VNGGECFVSGLAHHAFRSLLNPEGLVEANGNFLLLLLSLDGVKEVEWHFHRADVKLAVRLVEFIGSNTLVAVVEWVSKFVAVSSPGGH